MKFIIYFFTIVIVLYAGCKQQDTLMVPSQEKIGGEFSTTFSDSSNDTVDLGAIQNTSSFSLAIANSGNRPITGITVQNSNPMFGITSPSFDTLDAGSTLQSARIMSITVTHGTNPSGIGLAPTLPMGNNYDTLLISGRTINSHGKSDTLELKKILKVYALLADIRLFDDTTEVDLTKRTMEETGSGITTEEVWGYPLTHPKGTIFNSGNVPLDITEYQFGFSILYERLLQPNEIDTVHDFNTIVINTKGTVTIDSRLHIASDGKCYFFLQ